MLLRYSRICLGIRNRGALFVSRVVDGCVCIVLVLRVCVCLFDVEFARRGYCFGVDGVVDVVMI